jgi:hypothetical protein
MSFNGRLVKGIGVALNDFQGILGTFTDAGPQTIAQVVADDLGFAVHDGQRSFGTTDDAIAATVTSFFINLNDFAFKFHTFTLIKSNFRP